MLGSIRRAQTRPRGIVLAVATAMLLTTACSSEPPTATPPTGEPTPDASSAAAEAPGDGTLDNTAALEAVYAAVDGLVGTERSDVLLALAAEEDALDIYGAMNLDDMQALLDGFEDAYGLEPNYYRAGSGDILRRIEQEVDAAYAGNDVVHLNGPDLAPLVDADRLASLRTPLSADVFAAGVSETAIALYSTAFIAGWNDDTVSQAPTTWLELFTDFDGRLAFEREDWPWFATLTTQHFMADLGMTEAEVVDMFKAAAANATVVSGHTLMAELVVAGEYDVAASLYHHRVEQFRNEGAPISWEDPLEPIIVRPGSVSIMKHVKNPATALLWIEWCLTEGQTVLADLGRSPASSKVDGGIPLTYDIISMDLDAVNAQRDKWEAIWMEIIDLAGQ